MACTSCSAQTQGVCDCCRLVDGDTTFKVVTYCDACDAYICLPCSKNYIKRVLAYGLEKFQKVKNIFKK